MVIRRALAVAADLGAPLGEGAEARAERAALLLATFFMMVTAVAWSALYAALGRPLTAAIPGGYALVTALSLGATALTRRIDIYRFTQILLIVVLPFGVQASLGGFEQSSAVMLWAFMPVAGTLIFHSRYAGWWLVFYLVGLLVIALWNDALRERVAPLGPAVTAVFWVGNIGGVSFAVFLLMRHFIGFVKLQRQRAEDALRTVESQASELREVRERLEHEVEVARGIQLAMLPRDISVTGMDVAASMAPASEVGGDYFDVIPSDGGCWIGVGDVSGHGLTAGLIALMVQSVVATLVERDFTARPSALVTAANRVLYSNIHHRLLKEAFVTFCLLHFTEDGHVEFAGAHEPLLVVRARTRRCDVVATSGSWLAVVPDIATSVPTSTVDLELGDLLVLHTDGITEAMDESGAPFGVERLVQLLERSADDSVHDIRDRVLDAVRAWQPEAHDDRTLLVARYCGAAS